MTSSSVEARYAGRQADADLPYASTVLPQRQARKNATAWPVRRNNHAIRPGDLGRTANLKEIRVLRDNHGGNGARRNGTGLR